WHCAWFQACHQRKPPVSRVIRPATPAEPEAFNLRKRQPHVERLPGGQSRESRVPHTYDRERHSIQPNRFSDGSGSPAKRALPIPIVEHHHGCCAGLLVRGLKRSPQYGTHIKSLKVISRNEFSRGHARGTVSAQVQPRRPSKRRHTREEFLLASNR